MNTLDFFKFSEKKLFHACIKVLKSYNYEVSASKTIDDQSYIYGRPASDIIPICAVAHLDTVHEESPVTINQKNNTLTSPEGIGGDDRCGVLIIYRLLQAGLRPSVLFFTGEEQGGKGARTFINEYKTIENINWFLEFDKQGHNFVTNYDDQNDQLINEFIDKGFEDGGGTFSDIKVLCPHFKISGVNISAGYFKPHSKEEFVDLNALGNIAKRAENIMASDLVKTKFEYQ